MSEEVPRYAEWRVRLFEIYLRRYFRRSFHAVRTSGSVPETTRPLIVYTNHPSWWDPIHMKLVAAIELPGLRVFGPMDAEALERYRIFATMGAFPVDRDSPRSAARFVTRSLAILGAPRSSLWLTAEGQFTDPRTRPVRLKPGLGHLARRLDSVSIVPLAFEYPFWNERFPEALSRFGEPVTVEGADERSTDDWTALLAARLQDTMDRLATDASTREAARFRPLLGGSAGVGGVYDLWRGLRAGARGKRFTAAHEPDGR